MGKDIVFVVNIMGRGGASRVISILANHYANKGWNVTLILRDIQKSYELHPNIDIIRIGMSKIYRLKWINAIRKYIQNHPKAVVVSFQSMVNVYTVLGALGKNVRLILSERNDIKLANPKHVFKLASWAYSRADVVVFQSKKVKNYFSKEIQDKSTIILNPVTVPCYASDYVEKKIVNSGRLAPQKNQELLIEAFSQFHEQFPEYKLYIYGEGELRKRLEAKVAELKLVDFVFLPGNVKNIHELTADASMFVLSSDFEGLSNSLLESMMMGVPCISTACAGSDELIVSGENGLLVPIGDKVALCNSMCALANDMDLRKRIIMNSKKSSTLFKYENVIRQWEDIFEA